MAIYKNSPPDTLNFLQATGITNSTQIRAISTLVTDLKYAGVWDKSRGIYPFVGGTATTHNFNLKDPKDSTNSNAISFTGGWTHASTGVTGNGSTNSATFGIVPSLDLSDSSVHFSIYSRTNTAAQFTDIGYYPGSNFPALTLFTRWSDGIYYNDIYNYNTNRVQVANADSLGFYIISRESTTSLKSFKNGAQVGSTNTNAVSGRTSLTGQVYLGSRNDGFRSTREYAFMSFGEGLTNTEAAAYYIAVQKFQTTLGRNV